MSVSTGDQMSKEWQEATSYRISDGDIERARLLLGVDFASRQREYVTKATPDTIRNFAHGVGNDNPLHCDPEYARRTRWGGVIAPNMMAGIINAPMRGDPMTPEQKALSKSLFKGVHVFVSGGEWIWYRPIYPRDMLYSIEGDESLDVKPSEFAGRSINRIGRRVKINQRGEVVAIYRTRRILTERDTARHRGKYSEIKPATYTDEDIARIDDIYENERRRGAEMRYWEDTQVGDTLGTMAKGPLTVTDIICCHAGGYGFVPYAPTVGRLAYQNRKRIPAFYIKNEAGIPDVAQRLHWDSAWAQAIGNPMAYDYGVMRENYLYHYLTDWAGDDAWVVRQYDEIRKFSYMGDLQIITGEVTGRRQEGSQYLVDVVARATNQRDEHTLIAEATIALPSRAEGPVILPEVPVPLQRRALTMMQRHWQLTSQG